MAIEIRFRILKDPISASTHFAGFIAAVVGLVVLLLLSAHDGLKVTSMAIYGGGLVCALFASSLYHFLDIGDRGNEWLRRFDHAAVFLLIGGTYVPVLVHLLGGAWRITMLSVVGGLATVGVVFKLCGSRCAPWLDATIYLLIGWILVVPAYKILPQLSAGPLAWLAIGGAAYTIGVLIDVREWPNPWPGRFGFHEIWHILVLVGATSHYFFTLSLLQLPYPSF